MAENQEIVLNQWIDELMPWCPAQLYYYFEDADGGRWCIYLCWDGQRGDEPWSAELVRCDENWDFCWDSPDNVNLLAEKNHKPGVVNGYYYDKEYPFLMKKVLEIVRTRFPTIFFPIPPEDHPPKEEFINSIKKQHEQLTEWLSSRAWETASQDELVDMYDYLERLAMDHDLLAHGRYGVNPEPDDYDDFPEDVLEMWWDLQDLYLEINHETDYFSMLDDVKNDRDDE